MEYDLKVQTERIGDLKIRIECIKDLNKTIDQLFEDLEKSGNTALLEDLCPYFGVIWPSARALSEFIASVGKSQFEGRSVLELGCGLALPSLVVAKLGARVTATDFHPEVWKFLDKNIFLNQVEQLRFEKLDWKKLGEEAPNSLIQDGEPIPQDWIIGSDVLYEKEHALALAQVISRFLSPSGQALIADPGRPYLQVFIDHMKELGMHCQTEIQTVDTDTGFKDIYILKLSRGA